MKHMHYQGFATNRFFWRTIQQQEIDYIEEYDGKLHAYEFKWSTDKTPKFSKTFLNAYPNTETKIINVDNFSEFVM